MTRFLPFVCVLMAVADAVVGADQARTNDVAFTAACDGTEQRYVQMLPADYEAGQPHDLLIALHGHGVTKGSVMVYCHPFRGMTKSHD